MRSRPTWRNMARRSRKQAEALYARLNVDAAKQKAQLEQLMATLSAGDVRRGQLVFHSEKAACYSCHAIGYRGGNVGPDLTRIGSVRSERDLLEAIVFPSVSFVRSFEPIAVATQRRQGLQRPDPRRDRRRIDAGHRRQPGGADRPPPDRGDAPEHRLDHARGPRPATDPPRTGRPGRFSQGMQVVQRWPHLTEPWHRRSDPVIQKPGQNDAFRRRAGAIPQLHRAICSTRRHAHLPS